MNSNTTKVVGTVLSTKDYGIFQKLEGNRDVLNARKEKIKKSVKMNGQLFSPITVNEHMQIIDGQARFEVFKELGLPICYIIHPGMTLNDCVVLNSTATSWTLNDYIDSYVELGNENYINFKKLMQQHKIVPVNVVLYAVAMKINKGQDNDIKGGGLIATVEQCEKAHERLTYAERFLPNFKDGNKAYLLQAAMFAMGVSGIDTERLVDKWNKFGNVKSVSVPITNIYDAVGVLERAYNFKSSANSVCYIQSEYDRACREKTASYANRWQKKRKSA